MMLKKILLSGLFCVLFVFTACSNSDKDVNPAIIPPENIKQPVEAFGVVKPVETIDVFIPFTASIDKIHVMEGQTVKKNDVLMTLDLRTFMSGIELKEMEIKNYTGRIAGLKKELSEKNNEVNRIEDDNPDIMKLLNDLKYAEKDYAEAFDRKAGEEELLEVGAISRKEFNDFLSQLEQLEKKIEDIKFSLSVLKENSADAIKEKLNVLNQSLKDDSEKVESLKYELKIMKEELNRSYLKGNDIICDIDNGLINEVNYNAGGTASPAVKLLSIINLDTIRIEANVDEQFIKAVKAGTKVTIIPDYDKDIKLTGKVQTISASAVQKNGETTIPVLISIDKNSDLLKVNFNVEVRIDVV